MNKITKTIISLFFAGVGVYIANYLLTMYLTHHITPRLYGEFAVAMRVLMLASTLALLGTNLTSRRFLSAFLKQHQESKIQSYISWNLRVVTLSFLASIVFAGLLLSTMGFMHHAHIKHIKTYHLCVYMLWITPCLASTLLLRSFLLCAQQHYLPPISDIAKSLLQLAVIAGAVYFFSVDLTRITITLLILLAVLILLFFEMMTLRVSLPAFFTKDTLRFWKKKLEVDKQWFATSQQLILTNFLYLFISLSDLIIVAIGTKTPENTGKYAVALTISGIIYVAVNCTYNVVKSKISTFLEVTQDKKTLQKLITSTNYVAITAIIILFFLLSFFAKPLLFLFGATYTSVKFIFIIITFNNCLYACSIPYRLILGYAGNQKLLVKISVVASVAQICVLLPVTFFFGILGTALGSTLIALLFLIPGLISTQRIGIKSLSIF